MKKNIYATCLGIAAALFSGCNSKKQQATAPPPASNRVVLYCSVDDVYAKPIVQNLEKETGLKIDVLYDTEAAKTAGLANRIRAEKRRPQGDVFWSSALLQTLLLKREGLLQPYVSPSAKDIPAAFKAKDGSWTGLGVRARIAVRGDLSAKDKNYAFGTIPSSIESLVHYPGVGISNPQFGTASDWVAALAVRWKKNAALGYFKNLKSKGVRVLPGNSVVAEKIARGELFFGVTDTDDYFATKKKGVIEVLPMANNSTNPVFIPGSVAILKKAPHVANARKLMDALLKVETEKQLVETMTGVMPLRAGIDLKEPELKSLMKRLKNAPDDTAKWPVAWDEIREPLAEILLKD